MALAMSVSLMHRGYGVFPRACGESQITRSVDIVGFNEYWGWYDILFQSPDSETGKPVSTAYDAGAADSIPGYAAHWTFGHDLTGILNGTPQATSRQAK